MNAIIFDRATPWMKKKDLSKELSCSISHIERLITGIRVEIANGRYSPYVISGERYNLYAVIDYNTFRDMLVDPNFRKNVPPFKPKEIAELSGFGSRVVNI